MLGRAISEDRLVVHDEEFSNNAVDMPLSVLLGKPPKMTRKVKREHVELPRFDTKDIVLKDAIERVLRLPSVADKTFLISIGDRTVGGMTARDQMVGPWQVPVADVAVTLMSFNSCRGEAFALGERTPIAVLNAPASGRMAIGEAITNIAAAQINHIGDIKLSANWMAAAGHHGEDAALFDTVKAVGMELCPELGISIPVGKDSMSMKTTWTEPLPPSRGKVGMGVEESSTTQASTLSPTLPLQGGGDSTVVKKEVTAPLSLIVTAFAPCSDARLTLTPQLAADTDTVVLLFDLGCGKNRLGGSALAQVYKQVGDVAPDVDDAKRLKAFFHLIQRFNREGKLLAYHDRSDGGMLAALCEMTFASHIGLDIRLDECKGDDLGNLFNEELGALVQVRRADLADIFVQCDEAGLTCVHEVARLNTSGTINISRGKTILVQRERDHVAPHLVRDHLPHAAAARQPGLRAAGIRPHPRREGCRVCMPSSPTTPTRTSRPHC